LTDMVDQSEDPDAPKQLFQLCKTNAARSIFSSFIGIGVDFDVSVTTAISKVRGANYFCVFNEDEFCEMLRQNFVYNFFPAYFGVKLTISVPGVYQIAQVFGNPIAGHRDQKQGKDPIELWSPATHSHFPRSFRQHVRFLLLCQARGSVPRLPLVILGSIMNFLSPRVCCSFDIDTVFPSATDAVSGCPYGGAIVIQLQRNQEVTFDSKEESSDSVKAKVKVEYKDRQGESHVQHTTIDIRGLDPNQKDDSSKVSCFSSPAVHKAVLLQQFVFVLKQILTLAQVKTIDRQDLLSVEKFSSFFATHCDQLKDPSLKADQFLMGQFIQQLRDQQLRDANQKCCLQ